MNAITQRERLTLLGSAIGCTEIAPDVLKQEPRKIRTSHVYPPIPNRNFDWAAIDDNTYCGCEECHCPVGHGATEQEAIADLLEQLEEREAEANAVDHLKGCGHYDGEACSKNCEQDCADDARYEQFAGQQPWSGRITPWPHQS